MCLWLQEQFSKHFITVVQLMGKKLSMRETNSKSFVQNLLNLTRLFFLVHYRLRYLDWERDIHILWRKVPFFESRLEGNIYQFQYIFHSNFGPPATRRNMDRSNGLPRHGTPGPPTSRPTLNPYQQTILVPQGRPTPPTPFMHLRPLDILYSPPSIHTS